MVVVGGGGAVTVQREGGHVYSFALWYVRYVHLLDYCTPARTHCDAYTHTYVYTYVVNSRIRKRF